MPRFYLGAALSLALVVAVGFGRTVNSGLVLKTTKHITGVEL
jgi:hypothetical protein